MDLIASFGSCLSDCVANTLASRRGMKFCSKVLHNRSDYFVQTFIERRNPPSDLSFLRKHIREGVDTTFLELVHQNQVPETIGLHQVDCDVPFLERIERGDLSLLIADNFMDVASNLFEERATGHFYFSHSAQFDDETFERLFRWREYPSPFRSLSAFLTIFRWIHEKSPKTKVVFYAFPPVDDGVDRASYGRCREFAKLVTNQRMELRALLPWVRFLEAPVARREDIEPGIPDNWSHFTQAYYDVVTDRLELDLRAPTVATP
ncbi:MAG TPA: hypothetical protein VHE30_29045 [Polyangiaceae bacterium]|nr:hypothetical protein [Polyangiaceae bacterium]